MDLMKVIKVVPTALRELAVAGVTEMPPGRSFLHICECTASPPPHGPMGPVLNLTFSWKYQPAIWNGFIKRFKFQALR